MHKINLNTSATVVPVTNAIRAKKGDYLFVKDEGDIVVIDNKTFQALTKTELVVKMGTDKVSNGTSEGLNGSFLDQDILNTKILNNLEDPITTTDLMKEMLGPKLPYNKVEYKRVYHSLGRLKNAGKIESVLVDDEYNKELKRPVHLWGLRKKNEDSGDE